MIYKTVLSIKVSQKKSTIKQYVNHAYSVLIRNDDADKYKTVYKHFSPIAIKS